MKRFFILFVVMAAIASCGSPSEKVQGDGTASSLFEGTVDYSANFTGEQLRIDLLLAGDNASHSAYFDKIYREPQWAGSPNSLIDKFGYGQYFYEVFKENQLIFSKGFNTLFEEWVSTEQASTTPMSMKQTVWMPCPREKVHFVLYHRVHNTGIFTKELEFDIDPADRHIIPVAENNGNRVEVLQYKGDPANKVDLLFLAEGYSADKIGKYLADAERIMEYFFSMEPYASRRDDFNVRAVCNISEDSGVDIPQNGLWRNSVMDSSFDTFYEDRYLTIQDHSKIADAALGVPFDALVIIADETKYGGGGIYNSYAMGTSDNQLSLEVMIHEFGHSFAGLGDEYFDSSVAYNDFYCLDIEPWEPNVTTLKDFDSKWKDMIEEGTPVPTPADSTRFGLVGVFEGAGYMTYGCYRPSFDCRMRTNFAPGFCPVCQRAISRMIDYYVQ